MVSTFCRHCGALNPQFRCASCREVSYCNKDHQVAHWKNGHSAACKFVHINPVSVFVEVKEGEGNGINNTMIQHIFSNKDAGLKYVETLPEFSNGYTSRPLRSAFCEMLGWDVEMFCNTQRNRIQPPEEGLVDVKGDGELEHLNGAGIYLGCDVQTGISRYIDVDGRIFVTGRNQQTGRSLTSDILWGVLNFIWDAMSLYGSPGGPDTATLAEWTSKYRQGLWQPKGANDENFDVYCVVPEDCRVAQRNIDHSLVQRRVSTAEG